ncbi:MAG: DUF1254 domain-containing protein [Roseiarcus sp.]|jgi:hypothetical protein
MQITRRAAALGGAATLAYAASGGFALADWGGLFGGLGENLDDLGIAIEAYIYGYPLVTTEMTRRVGSNVAAPQGSRGPMGQFVKLRQYPDASFRDVTTPNADTLYTSAFLDVAKEPWIVGFPDMNGRYFLAPMLDAWTNVFQSPGTRTTGSAAQTYAITGPGWTGSLPPGVKEYRSPTSLVWIIGRIYCTGAPEDYAAVHALQDKFTLVPLSAYGKAYTPPSGRVDPSIDMKTAVRDQVDRMDTVAYFKLLAQLMKANPPASEDAAAVAKFAQIGLVPGHDFDASRLRAAFAKRVPQIARDRIMLQLRLNKDIQRVNGWMFSAKMGIYGADYLSRALVTAIGFGANLPEDAVYPMSDRDADGRAYDGVKKYVLRFEKGATPPVSAFWSISMYDSQNFFVVNPLGRYAISPRQNLKVGADGSIDIYIQKDSPGADRESNWLPAPAGKFVLVMRLYWPNATDPSILDGTWKPPGVRRTL